MPHLNLKNLKATGSNKNFNNSNYAEQLKKVTFG